MKQVISHRTRDLTIGGIIDQDQIEIGTTSGSVAGIFFNNGKENLPGVRYNKQTSQWEASLDGVTWQPFIQEGDVPYDVINITSSDLVDGVATITHNLGIKYPLGIGFTITPDDIEYVDTTTLKINYGSQSLSDFHAQVWFYNSKQSMLAGGTNEA
nr:MAG TPA: hypothetical protein [Bacteriophage sp.]